MAFYFYYNPSHYPSRFLKVVYFHNLDDVDDLCDNCRPWVLHQNSIFEQFILRIKHQQYLERIKQLTPPTPGSLMCCETSFIVYFVVCPF